MAYFPYEWTLKDAVFTKDKGTVFSCFACGGGSTMGYKLAGFDVIGCNEIDPKMMEAYITNHNPKYSYLEPIQTFKLRNDLPEELYDLDILDGSPPCSNFSMAGNREKDWGKEKKFREGQKEQVLDTLFFDFIDLAKKLQPKVVVAENVKGLLLGNAIKYVKRIYKHFDEAGYYCQHWLLDASKMGVPQKRERVFFICLRKDLAPKFLKRVNLLETLPKLKLKFNEPEIPFNKISQKAKEFDKQVYIDKWEQLPEGLSWNKVSEENRFSTIKINFDQVLPTITASQRKSFYTGFLHPRQKRKLCDKEFILGGTFPIDYKIGNKKNENYIAYLIGMSVPPVMTANISTEIYNQWLSKLKSI